MTQRTSLLALCFALAANAAFAASPRLGVIIPRGVQRGAEHELRFNGSNLKDAQEILFYDKGFEVTSLEGFDNNVKVMVKVAPDCRLGEHIAQVRTASGISDYRTFFVGPFAAVAEQEPNTDFAAPQAIEMNVTVDGIVQNEDVDYYIVDAKKGQRISAEVEGMRLGAALFDPYVAILDAKRFELDAEDDTPLVLQDAVASIVAPEDGKYVIEVRESAYGGSGACRYRLHVGTFPRPTAAFPAGGKLGDQLDVKFLGDAAGDLVQKVSLPAAAVSNQFGLFATDAGGIAPSPNPFRLFEHGNAFEAEPNDALKQASPAELPLAFNGIIEKPGDVDWFKFQAKKGQVYEVECYARRVRSALDPVMNLHKADGAGIAGNDDSRGPDSYFRFTVPADGEYAIRVRDHLGRGGPDFVYRIEFQAVRPTLALSIPRVERYGQYRQQIYVAKGNRFATLINAGRGNFGGDLVLEGNDLPAGLTMHADAMPSNLSSMPVVFEAAADAALSGKLVDFTARHAEAEKDIRGGFRNRADFIVGSPGQSVYKAVDVDRLAIAVVDEIPFKIELVEPKVPLVRNGEMKLKIKATRKEGFKAAINVQFPFRPPGVSAASSVTIPEGKDEVLYPINANGSAQIKKWRVFALASSGGNWGSSQLANLEVAEPFIAFALDRASCEQGQDAQVYCKLTCATPFDGAAKAQLLGLPNKVTTTDLEFNKETKELTFGIKTDPASPVGKHNLLCRITITQNGEPIVSRAGNVQLQIDKPLPAPVAKPAPMPKPMEVAKKPEPKPEPPKTKPLTRLQKLRLAAKKRAEEKAAGGGGE
jgi:hypothetical protein